MYLRAVRIRSTGVFDDASASFARSATVVSGKNNSGKSTVLAVASVAHGFESRRVLANEDLKRRGFAAKDAIAIRELVVEERDLIEICEMHGEVAIPLIKGIDPDAAAASVRAGHLCFRDVRGRRGERLLRELEINVPSNQSVVVYFHEGRFKTKRPVTYEARHAARFVELADANTFRFDADRSRASSRPVRPMIGIDSRGEELITAFNQLHASKRLEFLSIVRRVLPEIVRLEAVPAASIQGHVELRIWFGDDPRPELSFTLGEVGYGTANVLALLFAATMDARQRIILIDEPTTFLHPGAVRELMAVLAAQKQHQYIFATHSFVGLEYFPDAAFSLCQREIGSDTATIVNCGSGAAADTRRLLQDVGASLADVFAAEKIIWVEGPSDVEALREAITTLPTPPPRGLTLLPLIDTGSLEGKHGDLVAEVYRSLSTSAALIPPSIHFVLDPEKRTELALSELRKRLSTVKTGDAPAPGLSVYPAKMLENLFLDAAVVADALGELAKAAGATPLMPCDAAAVDALWNAAKPDTQADRAAEPDRWSKEVHGAKVLDLTFAHFYGPALTYRKRHHAATFARAALRLDSPGGRQLRDFAASLLEPAKPRNTP